MNEFRNMIANNPLLGDPRRLPPVEKDADDPSFPPSTRTGAERQHSTPFTTLSRLLGSQPPESPEASRAPSYAAPSQQTQYQRQALPKDIASLPEHLYTRGMIDGRHSDIVVKAFGTSYNLHRIILDRSPFFATALSEPWLEASSKEIDVRPDDIDDNITKHSFELALKRLYRGHGVVEEEDDVAIGLFATGCWLEMPDLVESSIEAILRHMHTSNLGQLITLVTKNYYGRHGDKILASAKAMLCREGWRMPLHFWDDIPADIVQELVGGDGFFVHEEFNRFFLAKSILTRRLALKAHQFGLRDEKDSTKLAKPAEYQGHQALRAGVAVPSQLKSYAEIYNDTQIAPLTQLLDYGIYYVHLEFEQLQIIRAQRDCFGFQLLPDSIISNALWQQMELRSKVLNARDTELELGLAVEAKSGSTPTGDSIFRFGESRWSTGKTVKDKDAVSDEFDPDNIPKSQEPRQFWIPSSDCNIVMGGNAEPVFSTPQAGSGHEQRDGRHGGRSSSDEHAFYDSAAAQTASKAGTSDVQSSEARPATYSAMPPFRFSAEFPSAKLLKEKKRVYSRTVFYAGSLWNIYIQKVASARSTKQLGVYLHRAKERELEEAVYAANGSSSQNASVEGRIGQLEREMTGRHRLSSNEANSQRSSWQNVSSRMSRRASARTKTDSQSDDRSSLLTSEWSRLSEFETYATEYDDSDSDSQNLAMLQGDSFISALPPYLDARPTIRTYFKIFSPSRGGRMLSVYESAPDKFNFSQSWGWKSSTLMLDEGLMSQDELDQLDGVEKLAATPGYRDEMTEILERRGFMDTGSRLSDGKLRFMVVIGNI